MYDGAHVLGLIAGGVFQDPLREGADIMTGSSHKTFPGPQGGFLLSSSEDASFHRRLNNAMFPVCAPLIICITLQEKSLHLLSLRHLVKPMQLILYAMQRPSLSHSLQKGLMFLRVKRLHGIASGSHGHGDTDSGAVRRCCKLEDAGIITNMNMLPGDTKAMSPSGLRLGVQELTRVGMGVNEMAEVASLYARVLLNRKRLSRYEMTFNT